MIMHDRYFLKWKLFHENISESLRELREDEDFFNVTLAFEDDKKIETNGFILSAYSPMLKDIIKRNNKQMHTIIFLSGMNHSIISSLLDFMYNGEVSVPKENVNLFLLSAKVLKVKGLSQVYSDELDENDAKDTEDVPNSDSMINKMEDVKGEIPEKEQVDLKNQRKLVKNVINYQELKAGKNNAETSKNHKCSRCEEHFQELDQLDSHFTYYHGQGSEIYCPICNKKFGNRNTRNVHKFRHHKKLL